MFSRRRLGPYLDGALTGGASRRLERHLGGCPRCQREVEALRRLRRLIHHAMVASPEPDWTAFWPGVVRGIQDHRVPAPVTLRRRWGARWAVGGTAVAGAALSVVLWFGNSSVSPEESVVVTAADTQYPGGTMVYHTPDKVAVVWVFDE